MKHIAKAIRVAARRELKADASAWCEFKRHRQRVKPLVWKAFAALNLLLMPTFTLFCLQRKALPARAGWASLILFFGLCSSVATLVNLAAKRAQHLERLPISDPDIFHVAWREFGFTALGTIPAFVCLFHWLVPGGDRSELWLHTAAGLLLTGTLIATMCVAMVWLQAARWAQAALNMAWMFFILIINASGEGDSGLPWIRAVVDQIGTCARLVTPPGWVVTWFIERPAGEARAALWLVPVAVVLAAGFPAWRRLRDSYLVAESGPSLPQLTPAQAMQLRYIIRRNELAVPCLHGVTAIEDSLRSRAFLAARPGFDVGWVDRLVWRWLTARERVLLDFMVLALPKWTRRWYMGLAAGAGGLLLSVQLRATHPETYWLAAAGGGLGLLVMALPIGNGLMRAFGMCPVAGGAPMTFAGCLPVGYAEVFRVDWKISLVRALAGLPVVLAFGAALAALLNAAPLLGVIIALKAVFGVLVLRLPMVTFMFSSGTNDSQLSKFRGWVMLGTAIFVAFTALGLGVASVTLTAWWNLLTLPAVALLCWGFHIFHRRCYDRMVFDLQPSTLLGQHPVG